MYAKLMNGKAKVVATNNYTGIGILNVRKRLELLYPGKHELTITDAEDVFIVNLLVELEKMAHAAGEIICTYAPVVYRFHQ